MHALFVYLLLEFGGSLSLSAIFTANMIYQTTVAALVTAGLVPAPVLPLYRLAQRSERDAVVMSDQSSEGA